MKTVREVLELYMRENNAVFVSADVDVLLSALDSAGYVIVPKEVDATQAEAVADAINDRALSDHGYQESYYRADAGGVQDAWRHILSAARPK